MNEIPIPVSAGPRVGVPLGLRPITNGIVVLAIAAAAAVVAWPGAATVLAHGEIAESDPAPGAVLAAAPAEIVVTLSEPVTNASAIEVLDDGFQKVDTGPLRLDPAVPGRIAVAVDVLPAGDYTVQWSAIDAEDGHKTQGSFVFTVQAATEGTGIADGTVNTDGTVSTDAAGGVSASLPGAVWWGWVVVIMGGAVGVWLARRSRSKGSQGEDEVAR